MAATAKRLYRFIDRGDRTGSKPKWMLQCFNFYPSVGPKGTPGRGPYCYGWFDVRASDRGKAEAKLAEQGFEVMPAGLIG